MFGVFRGEEGALVVIEPPGDFGIGAVFEINDGVLVAVEQAFVEELGGAVGQTSVDELGARVKRPIEKTAKVRGRSGSVETVVVIEDPYTHAVTVEENLTACLKIDEKAIGK